MSDDPNVGLGSRDRSSGGRLRGLLFIPLFRGWARRSRGDEVPAAVRFNHRVDQLVQFAMELASEGRSDSAAVEQLLTSAKRRGDLLDAAAYIRQGGVAEEDRTSWLANHLLISAATGQPVPHLSDSERAWFEEVERLMTMPLDEGFDKLSEMQPRLRDLANRISQNGDSISSFPELMKELQPLVGRRTLEGDRLVRSQTAYNIAESHLAALAGLIDLDSPQEH